MSFKATILGAATLLVLGGFGAAQADPAPARATTYGTLGYTYLHADPYNLGIDLGAVTARVGTRLTKYFGAELEGSAGVVDQTYRSGAVTAKISMENQVAAYLVGYWPVQPKLDLFARAGYGSARLKASVSGVGSASSNSDITALGGGGQYFFDANNGVRAEYTRYSFAKSHAGDANSFSVSYVRKF